MALEAANLVIDGIMQHCERIEIAGSLRRGREMVGDVDLVAIAGPGAALRIGQVMRELHVGAAKDYRAGEKMVSAVVRVPAEWTRGTEEAQWTEVQVDVYFATPENFGMLMVVRTGSAQHNVYMAKLARSLNMKFAAGSGVLDKDGNVMGAKTEEEVFGAFGLEVPVPEQREIICGMPAWMRK